MQLITQKGNYVKVPDNFILAVWGSTDMAITHGLPYVAVAQYPKLYDKAKEWNAGNKGGKLVGQTKGFLDPSGRRILMLFDRETSYEPPQKESARKCLEGMWKLLKPTNLRKVSIHPGKQGVEDTQKLIHDVLGDTDLQILLRHP